MSSHPKPTQDDVPDSKRVKLSNGSDSTPHARADAASAIFVAPSDWPPPGPIDLAKADLPHDSADTEWWYVNGHVKEEKTGHDLSFFASFFRICKKIHADGSMSVAQQQQHSDQSDTLEFI